MPARRLLLALFLLSDAAALLYQILWTRQLVLVFGSTTFAVSAVLTSFMVGLAVGAERFGRLADRVTRPVRLYAALEAGIAPLALLLPLPLKTLSALYPSFSAAALTFGSAEGATLVVPQRPILYRHSECCARNEKAPGRRPTPLPSNHQPQAYW